MPAPFVQTRAYGAHPAQAGDLYLPPSQPVGVVCLLHGGFWRAPHGRDQLAPIAIDLAAHGFAVWNLGYRRVGDAGGGWPGTLEDVGAGIDHLARLAGDGAPVDVRRVVVAGHSAGGQLALWAALRDGPRGPRRVRPIAAVALAGVVDLASAHALGLGDGAVEALLEGSPDAQPARCRIASPIANVPLGVPTLLLHGQRDDAVPIAMSRSYVQAAGAAGERVELVELADAAHMDFLDPSGRAHGVLRHRVASLFAPLAK